MIGGDKNEDLRRGINTLWVGGLISEPTESAIWKAFSTVGPIESVKLVPSKQCAFVTFEREKDVPLALEMMQNTRIGSDTVKLGYAHHQSLMSDGRSIKSNSITLTTTTTTLTTVGLPNPTLMSTYLPGDFPAELDPHHLNSIFAPTPEEQIRTRAFSIPALKPISSASILMQNHTMKEDAYEEIIPPTVMLPEKEALYHVESTEISDSIHHIQDFITPLPQLPPPFFGPELTSSRIRDYRKHAENPNCKPSEFNLIATEVIPYLVSASTDPIGNVLVQKLIERGSDELKMVIIRNLAPLLASVGIHKNGTWVVQKLINWCYLPEHQDSVAEALRPYLVSLLHDQFGNYVIQCCLQFASGRNEFIFDGFTKHPLDIATSRFGSRAMRSCLESPHTTAKQQKSIAMVLVEVAETLLLDPNGIILMQWLVDSDLPGRFSLLLEATVKVLPSLVTQRFSNNVLGKLLLQMSEPEVRSRLLEVLIENADDPNSTFASFLREPSNAITCHRLCSANKSVQRLAYFDAIKKSLKYLTVAQYPHLQRILDEINGTASIPPKYAYQRQPGYSANSSEDSSSTISHTPSPVPFPKSTSHDLASRDSYREGFSHGPTLHHGRDGRDQSNDRH